MFPVATKSTVLIVLFATKLLKNALDVQLNRGDIITVFAEIPSKNATPLELMFSERIMVFDVNPLTKAVPVVLSVAVLTKEFAVIESVIKVLAIIALFATFKPKPTPLSITFAVETVVPNKLAFDETIKEPIVVVFATDKAVPGLDKNNVPESFI
jgi:hypothetical protein